MNARNRGGAIMLPMVRGFAMSGKVTPPERRVQ
jgi:hypothetical protein